MGAEKHYSKSGGGYVGGLLQLFDWNAKSRKKLFSSKSTVSEQSKQKKRYDGNLPVTRLALMDEDEILTGSSIKDSSEYSCASSVTDDEYGGARAPGVVARLMGLDSMPTSNISDPYSTPFLDSQSHQDAYWCSRNLSGKSHHRLNHSGNLQEKIEAPVRNVLEPKNLKISSRPIERFQTEMLPPKSAKSIPITHHKLLSPIKSANFIPSENAAHIMEAAARIIGPGPQATTTSKAKVPTVGSSSVPLKVRDLKEKVEAAQKPLKLSETSRKPGESSALKYLKGQSMNKSWNGPADSMSARAADSMSARASSDADECSSSTKGKGKSISLALQAKANVQKREGINPSGNRNLVGQRESNEVNSTEVFRSQPSTQKSTHKKTSTLGASNVLRQNNQKQNCSADKGKLPSKSSASKSQVRKSVGGDSSFLRYKSSNKTAGNSKPVTRRSSNSEVIDGSRRQEDSNSSTRNITCKKRSIDGNFHLDKNKSEKLIQSSDSKEKETNKRIGTDVISFTFTAPMTRSVAGPETCRGITEKGAAFSANYRSKGSVFVPDDNGSKFSFLGNNVIGGDALSNLLEQKLRELTHGVETSRNKAGNDDTSPPIFQELRPGVNDALSTTTSLESFRTQQKQMHRDEVVSQFSSGFSSTDLQGYIMKHKFQGMDHEMNKYPRSDIEAKNFLDCRLPSPLSVLEHSPFAESCNSSEIVDSISEGGSKQSSSVQAQEVFGISFSKKFSTFEADTELSDSASSLSTRTLASSSKQLITLTSKDSVESTEWELDYVNEILCNIELMFKDFAMGRAREIINPHLFDQLESRKTVYDGHGHESKLRRKVLFDSVTECLDIRCRRYAGGGYETWVKGLSLVKSKERLAEEVYREITGWIGTSDSMVDELVDSDMSNKHGKWLDFEIEAFELGVKIESRILNHLLDEVISDLL